MSQNLAQYTDKQIRDLAECAVGRHSEEEITLWPPIGGARGQTQWRATWVVNGKKMECFCSSEKSVLAKARRIIAKTLRE